MSRCEEGKEEETALLHVALVTESVVEVDIG